MSKFWVNAKMLRRKARSTFGNRSRVDGKEEYIIKIPGFSGELRKYMSEEEAIELIEKSNKSAFKQAASASKSGVYGYEQFSKHGYADDSCGSMGFFMAKAASRGFADKRKGDK